MMKLDLTPLLFFIFLMLLFCNSNTVHKFLNFCLGELLSALDTAGSNISKKNIKIIAQFSTGKIRM